jgi:hypothetical protein
MPEPMLRLVGGRKKIPDTYLRRTLPESIAKSKTNTNGVRINTLGLLTG